jgi:hypothetical protein
MEHEGHETTGRGSGDMEDGGKLNDRASVCYDDGWYGSVACV